MGWMPWTWFGPREPKLTAAEIDRVRNRSCKAMVAGLKTCRRANPGKEAAAACKSLEMMVVTCYACELCKPEAEAHRKCYTTLYKTGVYKGVGHCIPYEDAMIKCLKRKKMHPVP